MCIFDPRYAVMRSLPCVFLLFSFLGPAMRMRAPRSQDISGYYCGVISNKPTTAVDVLLLHTVDSICGTVRPVLVTF